VNAPARTYEFTPAVRDRVSLLIALAGASGSGKTRSALELARGLAGGDDSKIAFIDTEAGRAKHYAVVPGGKPDADHFAFQHCDLRAPFSPEAYVDAIKQADAAGFEVIVIDSCSHEYESEGGLHDIHDALVAVAVEKSKAIAASKGWQFDEAQARDRASVGAWNEPKSRHKRFVTRLLQCRAHLVLCLRADEKIRIEKVKDDRGRERTVIVQPKDMPANERWVPICEKRFMYEMTLSLVLTPQNPGVPIPIKLQQQHRDALPLDKQVSVTAGYALATWARGGTASPQATPGKPSAAGPAASPAQPNDPGEAADVYTSDDIAAFDKILSDAAERGMQTLGTDWALIPKSAKPSLKAALDRRHKPRAQEVDESNATLG
jgi:hypothetical protein